MPNALVVIGRKNTKITSINDLRNLRGVTSKGSSYEHALLQNKVDKSKFYYNQGNNFFKDAPPGDTFDIIFCRNVRIYFRKKSYGPGKRHSSSR